MVKSRAKPARHRNGRRDLVLRNRWCTRLPLVQENRLRCTEPCPHRLGEQLLLLVSKHYHTESSR